MLKGHHIDFKSATEEIPIFFYSSSGGASLLPDSSAVTIHWTAAR